MFRLNDINKNMKHENMDTKTFTRAKFVALTYNKLLTQSLVLLKRVFCLSEVVSGAYQMNSLDPASALGPSQPVPLMRQCI